jgi:hypothetical protein
MSIEQGRLSKVEIGDPGVEMDLVTGVERDNGINLEEITHLGSTAIERVAVLSDFQVTIKGYVDMSDTAQTSLRTAANSTTKVLTDLVITLSDESTTLTFPDTTMVSAYSESIDAKSLDTFSATIVSNGAVTIA